jgi:integrase
MAALKPFQHKASGRWIVQFPAKLSTNGKRQQSYFDSEEDAESEIKRRAGDKEEHGKQMVTAEERQWILYARSQLGALDLLPEVIRHWQRTGGGSVTPKTVKEAVEAFIAWQVKRVSSRTGSDIRWRLRAFADGFKERGLHQIHAGEIETWLHTRSSEWSVKSFYKRLRPLFDHALRHRWIAENPMLLLKPPESPRLRKAVYTGEQLQDLLFQADLVDAVGVKYVLPFVALAGFAWIRTAEMVRLYSHEDVLAWEDFDWKRKRIHIRAEVGKATRRRSGNERFVPISAYLENWLEVCKDRKGDVVPVLHHDFSVEIRKLHTAANVSALHNGLRRSAISHYLAANPEAGIGPLARMAGTSESTIKKHYLESLTPEEGAEWFQMGRKNA